VLLLPDIKLQRNVMFSYSDRIDPAQFSKKTATQMNRISSNNGS